MNDIDQKMYDHFNHTKWDMYIPFTMRKEYLATERIYTNEALMEFILATNKSDKLIARAKVAHEREKHIQMYIKAYGLTVIV
jgi:hypothetical protein